MQDWQSLAGAVVTLFVIYRVFMFLMGRAGRRRRVTGSDSAKGAPVPPGIGHPTRSHGPSQGPAAISPGAWVARDEIAGISTETGGANFFVQRKRRQDLKDDLEAQHDRFSKVRDNVLDDELSSWMEQEELRREQNRAQDEALRQAMYAPSDVTPVIRDIVEHAEAAGLEVVNRRRRPDNKALTEIYTRIMALSDEIAQESQDLDHVIDKLQTSIDFISMEFWQTVEEWKKGESHRFHSLNDLKHKYRLKTFSLEDAWELVFSYPDWVNKTRKHLLGFAARLGYEAESPSEGLAKLIERAQRQEWERDLDVDMDKIFLFKELGKMNTVLTSMTTRVAKLEEVCNRRSNQIIAPEWEPGRQNA